MKAMTLLVMTTLVAFSTSEVFGGEQHFPQEVPWSGRQSDLAQRLRLQRTVFPEFAVVGSFEEVIDHLRNEFRKHSRDGRSMGSFVIGDLERLPKRLNIRLRGRNSLEVIDNLCALSGYNWTVAPHAIVIDRPGAAAGKQAALFPHELPGEQKPRLAEPLVAELSMREWYVETMFPEFKFSGNLSDAIGHMMTESRKVSPDGMMVGGFTINNGDAEPGVGNRKLELDLKGKNAFEIIDTMCGATHATWVFMGRILIQDDSQANP